MSSDDVAGSPFPELRRMWSAADPVPDGLIDRMQAVTLAEAEIATTDLDYELLLLVERSTQTLGARSGSDGGYTLQFNCDSLELLVRIAGHRTDGRARLDGWVVPPEPARIRVGVIRGDTAAEAGPEVAVDGHGRFEFPDLAPGLYRLWLTTDDPADKPFGTPIFEI